MPESATPWAKQAPVIVVKPVYRLDEFCRDFGVGRTIAYQEIQSGRLRAFKLRGGTRITGKAALAFLALYASSQAA